MRLLLDIGNSRVKWALASGKNLEMRGVLNHRDNPNWHAALPWSRPESVWVASVANQALLNALERWVSQRWGLPVNCLVSQAESCGVVNAYARPERLGVDRWLACIAGHHRGSGSVLVVDAGTALTLDFVAAGGEHRGGLITPGVGCMRESIRGGTQVRADLHDFELTWLTTDTDPAVGVGTLRAALALVQGARADLQPARVLLTGGEAALLAAHLDADWEQVPDLVLEGLAQVAVAGL